MPSDAQHAESKIKDVRLCKTAGRSEITTANLHETMYQLMSDISKTTVTNAECVNRKKKSEKEESSFLLGRHFSKIMLTNCESCFATPHSKAEINNCRMTLSKNTSCMTRRTDDDCAKLVTFDD